MCRFKLISKHPAARNLRGGENLSPWKEKIYSPLIGKTHTRIHTHTQSHGETDIWCGRNLFSLVVSVKLCKKKFKSLKDELYPQGEWFQMLKDGDTEVDSIHHCEESCLDFSLTARGAAFKVSMKLGESRVAEVGKRENGAAGKWGGFLSPALLARSFLGVLLETAKINSNSVFPFYLSVKASGNQEQWKAVGVGHSRKFFRALDIWIGPYVPKKIQHKLESCFFWTKPYLIEICWDTQFTSLHCYILFNLVLLDMNA